MNLERKQFKDLNLGDPFFDSLKADYVEFEQWFQKKADHWAYVFLDEADESVQAFLYLKVEDGAVADVTPPLPAARRLKVGTLKINPHGTKLGERFLKKVFDHAVEDHTKQAYVTVFPKHTGIVTLFERYGFSKVGEKTTKNGTELVLLRDVLPNSGNILFDYPVVHFKGRHIYLLALYPIWHTRLLPDSILKNEDARIVQDISHTNSIHKVYLAAMPGMGQLERGDVLVIYRTSDNQGAAHYRSVATSICVVEEYRNIQSFKTETEFLGYCRPYSVFTEEELADFWRRKRYPHIIRFTYNVALTKRVNRKAMIEELGMDSEARWGFMPMTTQQLSGLLTRGEVDEGLVVD